MYKYVLIASYEPFIMLVAREMEVKAMAPGLDLLYFEDKRKF